jgi:hypothetical protein
MSNNGNKSQALGKLKGIAERILFVQREGKEENKEAEIARLHAEFSELRIAFVTNAARDAQLLGVGFSPYPNEAEIRAYASEQQDEELKRVFVLLATGLPPKEAESHVICAEEIRSLHAALKTVWGNELLTKRFAVWFAWESDAETDFTLQVSVFSRNSQTVAATALQAKRDQSTRGNEDWSEYGATPISHSKKEVIADVYRRTSARILSAQTTWQDVATALGATSGVSQRTCLNMVQAFLRRTGTK